MARSLLAGPKPYLAAAIAGIAILAYISTYTPDHVHIMEEGGSPPLGSADAPLTMIEWGDYQCTFCYRFHQNTLDDIMVYVDSGKLRIVFQDFPLNGHDSVLAAQAARCAADQGLFWEYHNVLYDNWGGERTGWISPPVLSGLP